jgi:phosphoribosylformylglycinamidine synthase
MHDVSDGGLAIALVECCVGGDPWQTAIGADVSLPVPSGNVIGALFAEEPSRVVASLSSQHLADVRARAERRGVPLLELGKTTARDLIVRVSGSELVRATLDELRNAREACLYPIVGE